MSKVWGSRQHWGGAHQTLALSSPGFPFVVLFLFSPHRALLSPPSFLITRSLQSHRLPGAMLVLCRCHCGYRGGVALYLAFRGQSHLVPCQPSGWAVSSAPVSGGNSALTTPWGSPSVLGPQSHRRTHTPAEAQDPQPPSSLHCSLYPSTCSPEIYLVLRAGRTSLVHDMGFHIF